MVALPPRLASDNSHSAPSRFVSWSSNHALTFRDLSLTFPGAVASAQIREPRALPGWI
jgi:hypothetical protein